MCFLCFQHYTVPYVWSKPMGVICLVYINTSCSPWGPNLSNSQIIPIKRFLDMREMASVLTKCESEDLVLTLMIQWSFSYIYFSICSLQSFVHYPLQHCLLWEQLPHHAMMLELRMLSTTHLQVAGRTGSPVPHALVSWGNRDDNGH